MYHGMPRTVNNDGIQLVGRVRHLLAVCCGSMTRSNAKKLVNATTPPLVVGYIDLVQRTPDGAASTHITPPARLLGPLDLAAVPQQPPQSLHQRTC